MPTCPHCGFDADPGSLACPLCGASPLDGASPDGPSSDVPPGPLPPWEDWGRPFGPRLIRTWTGSLFEPSAFFQAVRRGRSTAGPVLYYLLVSVIGAFFSLWWEAVGLWPPAWEAGPELGIELEMGGAATALLGFFLTPFAALLGLGVWSLVVHLFVALLAPQRDRLGATVRLLCYSAGPTVFSAVPLIGPLVGLVWITALQIVGVREVHRTTTGRACAAILAPLALILLAVAGLVLLLLVAGVALLESYGA